MNDVYKCGCGCVRNFARKALEKTDFDLELKEHEKRSLIACTQPQVKPSIKWMIYFVLAKGLIINHDKKAYTSRL